MQAVIEAGVVTTEEEFIIINRYQGHQQVLFASNILDMGGKCIDKKYLKQWQEGESWSTLIFPIEKPPRGHIRLWEQVLYSLAPRGWACQWVGQFLTKGHKIWDWRLDLSTTRLYHVKGQMMDIFTPSDIPVCANQSNYWTCFWWDVPHREHGEICSIRKVGMAAYRVVSSTDGPSISAPPTDFWSVVEGWGNTWMWENLTIKGDVSWLAEAIADNSLVVVTDGSYMKDMYPHLNSAAFIFECIKGRGHLWGSFIEHSPDASSYQGKLLGLMAIHLILKTVNEVSPNLTGSVKILSDCLGALNKVKDLPPYRIPTQCSHSDILKNIMVNCSELSFLLTFSHVKAHQDDKQDYGKLSWDAQLNCQMDYLVKIVILKVLATQDEQTKCFPLEPVCVLLKKNKVTSDKGERVRFWVQRQLARTRFYEANILNGHQFDLVNWEMVHTALRRVPRMFRIRAYKQVMDIAPANGNHPWERSLCPICPSCAQVPKTCSHVLFCPYDGRVDTMMKSITLLSSWMVEVDTDRTFLSALWSTLKEEVQLI